MVGHRWLGARTERMRFCMEEMLDGGGEIGGVLRRKKERNGG